MIMSDNEQLELKELPNRRRGVDMARKNARNAEKIPCRRCLFMTARSNLRSHQKHKRCKLTRMAIKHMCIKVLKKLPESEETQAEIDKIENQLLSL